MRKALGCTSIHPIRQEVVPLAKLYDTWWHPILAVPPAKSSSGYRRLRHIWMDQTRVRPTNGHEYFVHEYETHLTLALWETFAALPVRLWLPRLVERAGLTLPQATISDAEWSYGWLSDGVNEQIVDLVLNYRDTKGEGIVVVEAKRPGNRLGGKDLNPEYYLDIPAFRKYARRSILYLLGSDAIADGRVAVVAGGHDVGFLAWPDLGVVQMETAAVAFPDESVASLVAHAIYRHFGSYDQIPPVPPVAYLRTEPTRETLASMYKTKPQTNAERKLPLWSLGRG